MDEGELLIYSITHTINNTNKHICTNQSSMMISNPDPANFCNVKGKNSTDKPTWDLLKEKGERTKSPEIKEKISPILLDIISSRNKMENLCKIC